MMNPAELFTCSKEFFPCYTRLFQNRRQSSFR